MKLVMLVMCLALCACATAKPKPAVQEWDADAWDVDTYGENRMDGP